MKKQPKKVLRMFANEEKMQAERVVEPDGWRCAKEEPQYSSRQQLGGVITLCPPNLFLK